MPPFLSRNYTEQKKKRGENVHYLEISTAGHFDLIDPRSNAWPKVEGTVLHLVEQTVVGRWPWRCESVRSLADDRVDRRPNDCSHAQFLNTSAEFFDPNAMQLHTACSIAFFRPTSGT